VADNIIDMQFSYDMCDRPTPWGAPRSGSPGGKSFARRDSQSQYAAHDAESGFEQPKYAKHAIVYSVSARNMNYTSTY